MSEHWPPIVLLAIEKGGGITAFAEALGVKHPSIHNWRRIPSERVLQVEKITGIPRHLLRPDLYPAEEDA